jgi:hypothetical protein
MLSEESVSVSLQPCRLACGNSMLPSIRTFAPLLLEMARPQQDQGSENSIRPLMDVLPRNLLDSVLVFALPRSKWVRHDER